MLVPTFHSVQKRWPCLFQGEGSDVAIGHRKGRLQLAPHKLLPASQTQCSERWARRHERSSGMSSESPEQCAKLHMSLPNTLRDEGEASWVESRHESQSAESG